MTLNNIVDDIILTCKHIDEEKADKIPFRQVEIWIHQYRLLLIKQEISKNSIIDPKYISYRVFHFKEKATDQVGDNMEMVIQMNPNTHAYDSIEDMPTLAPLIGRVGICSALGYVADKKTEKKQIRVGDLTGSLYGAYDIYNPQSMLLSVYDKKLRLFKFGEELKVPVTANAWTFTVKCGLICANVEDYFQTNSTFSVRDEEYPLDDDKVIRIKQMIFANELQWIMPSRDTAQSSQMTKMEEQELNNNPATLMQTGSDLYEGLD